MVKFMPYEENYFDLCNSSKYRTVVYGAGAYLKRIFPYLSEHINYICDKQADTIKKYEETDVISPKELENIHEELLIIICVKKEEIRSEIKRELEKLAIDACVFDYFDNIAFDVYKESQNAGLSDKKEINSIRLICEDNGWILNKFAVKMREKLLERGYDCSIDSVVDPNADINHHLIYATCQPVTSCFHETFMITHIDSSNKLEFLKHQLKRAKLGICMSRETMDKLVVYGIPREKLCYINPAQDGVIKPKKYILGITHKTHEDHRKKENVLIDLCRELNPDYFSFKIMGSGWDDIVNSIRNMGFEVEYYSEFIYEKYIHLIPSLDYYLFWGFDEGSMGYLDALRAGIDTIVTPQGYHLDVKDGITYPCRTLYDFRDVLLSLQNRRKRIVESVDTWTWGNYVDKHLEVWNYVLGNEENIYKNQHMYEDGIFSVLKVNV